MYKTARITLLSGLLLMITAVAEVDQPETGTKFPETLQIGDDSLHCTGVSYRSKFGFKVYGIAHYGAAKAAPEGGAAPDQLDHWIRTPGPKAIALKFVYFAQASQIREASEEALTRAGYTGPNRDAILAAFDVDCDVGSELRLVVSSDGALRTELNGVSRGEWRGDSALIRAMWAAWLGPGSVINNRENLVARPLPAP